MQNSKVVTEKALVVNESDTFHFSIDTRDSPVDKKVSACARVKPYKDYKEIEEIEGEEAIKKGKEPCGLCIKSLKKVYNIEVRSCSLCNRINLFDNLGLSEIEIPYKLGDDKVAYICRNCRVNLQQ